ncbi:P-loop NTPase fold protein [Bremerella sp. JC817]|uniref:P-loop NTPase fold protein n=1 Tax=Bremerella sp. JC817 TaxID=3231756 RepID=UPI00345802C9
MDEIPIPNVPQETTEGKRRFWIVGVDDERSQLSMLDISSENEFVWSSTEASREIKPQDIVYFYSMVTKRLGGFGTVEEDQPTNGPPTVVARAVTVYGVDAPTLYEISGSNEFAELTRSLGNFQVIRRGIPISFIQARQLQQFLENEQLPAPGVCVDELATELRALLLEKLEALDPDLLPLTARSDPNAPRLDFLARMTAFEDAKTALQSIFRREDIERFRAKLSSYWLTYDLPGNSSSLFSRARSTIGEIQSLLDTYAIYWPGKPQDALAGLNFGRRETSPNESPNRQVDLLNLETTNRRSSGQLEAIRYADLREKEPLIWRWEEADKLGINGPVHTFAKYIAHRDLVPPKAIGIFGDWGSGKTFMMNALKSQIAQIAIHSARARETNQPTVYCSRVVQIEFNAWHYVESNLWASLAGHIFEQLYQKLTAQSKKEDKVAELFKQLETYQQASVDRDNAAQKVELLKKECQTRAQKLGDSTKALREYAKTTWDTVKQAFVQGLTQLNKKQTKQLKAAKSALHTEKIEELIDNAGEIKEMVSSSFTLGETIRLAVNSCGIVFYVISFILLLGLTVAAPLALSHFKIAPDGIFSAALGTWLTGGIAALTFLKNRGQNIVDAIRSTNDLIESARTQVEEERRNKFIELEAKVLEAENELVAAEKKLNEAQAELVGFTPRGKEEQLGTMLKEFLGNRVRDRTYEQHLGLISLVRKDFETLTRLQHEFWVNCNTPASPLLDEVEKLVPPGSEEVPFVERIVLYIDDIDRCPAETVAEVLQAAHLLLGFRLFVVVVGVDQRWITQALKEKYHNLIGLGPAEIDDDKQATATDYLEKIFQVPYQIPLLSHRAKESLVDSLSQRNLFEGWLDDDENATLPPFSTSPRQEDLDSGERDCLRCLARALGHSPRRVTRLFDSYRLYRSGMTEGELKLLKDKQHYHEILVLFALMTGSPMLAPTLFKKLHDDQGLRPDECGLPNFSDWFQINREAWSKQFEEHEIASAEAALAFLTETGAGVDSLERLLFRIPGVTRFSFCHKQFLWADDENVS